MTVLYVATQGAVIRRDADCVKVTRRPGRTRVDEVLRRIAVREVEQVVVCGNVQVTTQAVAMLLEREIDIIFLSHFGKYRGRLSQDGSRLARLRHAQLELAGDESRSLQLAKSLVSAKLTNQERLLGRLGEALQPTQRSLLAEAAAGIERQRHASLHAKNLDALRGFEGKAGAYYFGGLRGVLDGRWAFGGRKYHPAPDPLNALLSFGYALLQKDMTTTLHLVGLDPYIGCFHALEYGRPSLVLDLMEEFRPLAVDETVLALVFKEHISVQDFIYTGQAERPVELQEHAIPRVLQAYEASMARKVRHTDSNTEQTLRRCLELQARIYGRVVQKTRADYQGLVTA